MTRLMPARSATVRRAAPRVLHRRALVLALALGAVGVVLVATPAAAQIAAALGKPLPSPDLPVGTVSVRVVAGSASAPVVGTEVTLLVNNAPRAARTDSAGRATFPGLPAGATVVAKVLDQDKTEHPSESFEIPDSGGMRVMITTKPWQGGAEGGAPFAGGGAGMPNPRRLSGTARGEQADPAGTLTVRTAYDDFKDTPEGVSVVLFGYAADDSITYQAVKTDASGHAKFSGLDRSGGTSYFAMTLLPRNGAIDRLTSSPVVLDSQVGVRMVLSSEKRDSKAPAIDDFGKAYPQGGTPAGKVQVTLDGIADLTAKVSLVDAATRKVLGEAPTEAAPPDPSRVQGGAQFTADAKLPAGTLDVEVAGGAGQTEEPLPNVEIRVVPAGSQDASGGLVSLTGAGGTVRMALQASGPQKAVFTINGRQLVSQPFDLGKTGGKLAIRAQWEASGQPQAIVDVPATVAGQTVFAECMFKNKRYRSMPFQLLDGAGTNVAVYVYPRILFRFQLEAEVEDELFAVRGRFEVDNYSWAPYRAGPDGMVVAMPHGFKGAVIAETDQSEVSVAPGEGFRLIRPIPPGPRQFHAAFSLPVEAGKVSWALDLPLGAYESQLAVKRTPGISLQLPDGVNSEDRPTPQGTYALLGPITISPRQSMVLSVAGLPSRPLWRAWVQGIVGVLVVAIMLAGIALALVGRRRGDTADASEARRQRLLDELVQLEHSGANPARREQLLGELEQLWS